MRIKFLAQFACTVFVAIAIIVGATMTDVVAQDGATPSIGGHSSPGLVKQKPASAPFVKVDGGFMVPYTAKIPGTDLEFTMVPIRGGKFTMGSPSNEKGRLDDEGPQFEVIVEPFWMGKYEVTWAEYKRYMDLYLDFRKLQKRGLRKVNSKNEIDAVTAPSSLYDPTVSFGDGAGDDQPAATMSQFAAKQYTKWLSLLSGSFYRLPTESEWEYACRAGTKTTYYFGDDPAELKDHAWFVDSAGEERHAVGQLKPNPWGLYDMHGNVAEWVLDAYDDNGYSHIKAGGSVTTKDALRTSAKIFPKVVRGGSFELSAEECRSAARLGSHADWQMEDPDYPKSPWWYTDSPASGVGFRLIRPFAEPPTREAQNAFWNDGGKAFEDAKDRVEYNGRGAYGPVDPELPEDIEKLKDSDK